MDQNKRVDIKMKGYTVNNVERCPSCGSGNIGYVKKPFPYLGTYYTPCCCNCDNEVKNVKDVLLERGSGTISVKRDIKFHAKFTKNILDSWNVAVSKANGTEPVEVSICYDGDENGLK